MRLYEFYRMGKKSKKCSSGKSRRILWYAFTSLGLGARGLAALALVAISIKMHPLKYQSKFFNVCVEEMTETGSSISDSVRFCNGGDG